MLPLLKTEKGTFQSHSLQSRLESGNTGALLYDTGRKQVVDIQHAQQAPLCQLFLVAIDETADLQAMQSAATAGLMHPVPGCDQLHELLEVRRALPQHAPMYDAEHGDVSPHAERCQAEQPKRIEFAEPNFAKKTLLKSIYWFKNGAGRMEDARSPVLYEGQDIALPMADQIWDTEVTLASQQCSLLPTALLDQVSHCVAHGQLGVEADAQDLALSSYWIML